MSNFWVRENVRDDRSFFSVLLFANEKFWWQNDEKNSFFFTPFQLIHQELSRLVAEQRSQNDKERDMYKKMLGQDKEEAEPAQQENTVRTSSRCLREWKRFPDYHSTRGHSPGNSSSATIFWVTQRLIPG